MPRPKKQGTNLLLVEGTTDKYAILHLYRHMMDYKDGGRLPFKIRECNGRDSLLSQIHQVVEKRLGNNVAIVVDADQSVTQSWQAVTKNLTRSKKARIKTPDTPSAVSTEGFWVTWI